MCWNSPEGLWKQRLLGPTARVSDSVGLGWGLKICISNRMPAEAATAGPKTAL